MITTTAAFKVNSQILPSNVICKKMQESRPVSIQSADILIMSPLYDSVVVQQLPTLHLNFLKIKALYFDNPLLYILTGKTSDYSGTGQF